MRNFYKLCLFAALAILAMPIFAKNNNDVAPLEIGVVPYMSARVLVQSYEPMRLYLEQVLGKPVHLYTANGFKQFFLNAQKGDYDLVISAAHVARILQKNNHFKPVLHFAKSGRALVMVGSNSPVTTVQDIRGSSIAVPDRLSLAAIVAISSLRKSGLKEGVDYTILEVPSFTSAILSISKGEAMAAITAQVVIQQMSGDLQDSVKLLLDAGEFSNLVILTHPRISKSESVKIADILQNFQLKTKEGKSFISNIHFGEMLAVTAQDMQSLDRYTAETNHLMNISK
ncbi:MAG: phosphate/phosphite/phosphonate ABC transporter substrate-binding protein [Gallionellaceae bacterium]|jgi:phosphonate transport system substrate-binding protein